MSDTDAGSVDVGIGAGARVVDLAKVQATRDRLPSANEAVELAETFRLLADPTRTRILYALLEAGELCVGDVSATIDVPENTISQALRLLRTARIVDKRRDGRIMYYSLTDAHVHMILELCREHQRHSPTD